MAAGADEFGLFAWQLDILRGRDHELLGTVGTVHDRVEQLLAGGEPGRTMGTFESERHEILFDRNRPGDYWKS